MGQIEVLEYLKKQRKLNPKWLTLKDIKKGMECEGCTKCSIQRLYNHIYKLATFKQIEYRIIVVPELRKEYRGFK